MDKTVVLIKPDAFQRGLTGEMIDRFERKGLKLVGAKMIALTNDVLDDWYSHHKDKSFFEDLKKFMMQTPVLALVWQGIDAIKTVRTMIGPTKGREAPPGTIRGDFGMSAAQNNLIHASDSKASAKRELQLLFDDEEIFEYERATESLVYSDEER